MKKIKVAHVITRMIIGGAQENTLLSVDGLQRLSHYTVDLITGPTVGPEGSLLDNTERHDLNIILIPELRRKINLYYDVVSFFKLVSIIRKNKYEIIHTHSSKAGILCRLAARCARCPVIIHTIHGLPFHNYENPFLNKLYIILERFVSRYTDKIITVCPEMTKKSLSAHIGNPSQYISILSGINVSLFQNISSQSKSVLKNQLGIPNDAFVVGKIARLFHLKGHTYLLPAAATVIKKHPNTCFLLVGDGILNDMLQKKARHLGIEKNIIFCGLQPPNKIAHYLSIMDIVVHLSLREGLPRVVPQAFLLSRPVIVYDIDGAKDIVDNGLNGFLIPPESIDILSEKILFFLEHKEQRIQMGRNGHEKALKLFPHEYMINNLDIVYKKLLSIKISNY